MRSAPAVLSPDLQIAAAHLQVKDCALDAWPVIDAGGLCGMVRNSDLSQAASGGAPEKKVAELLGAGIGFGHSTARELPHVHPDHSLSLALERMGTSGLKVLPVVSRANVRQLIGVIALDDILDAYGVTNSRDRLPPPIG
jgi:CBS domain-containing protein